MTPEETKRAEEVNQLVESVKCFDRGVDPESGKRGRCHVFLDHSDICQCGDVDLRKERAR